MAEPPALDSSGEGILHLMQIQGGLVGSAELAIKLATAFFEAHYGKDGLVQQQPLIAVDKGTSWRIEGSLNRDGAVQGTGNFYISIEKFNARVTDFGCWARLGPESDAFTKALANAETPEEKQKLISDRFAALSSTEKTEK